VNTTSHPDHTLPLSGPGVTLETRADGLAVLLFDRPQEKVNTLGAPAVAVLEILVEQLARDDKVKGLIVASAKPGSFIAGADVHEIQGLRSTQEAESASRKGQRLFDNLEALPFPVVAAINGTCLGGGTELALACHFRVAADEPRTEIGLPEVRLGILPGWGGTQRLPRVVGLPKALDMILAGRTLNARKAIRAGLVDAIAPAESLLETAERVVRDAIAGRRRPRRVYDDGWFARFNPARRLRVALVAALARRGLRRRVPEHDYPAPYRALEAVGYGLTRGMEAGLDREARALGALALTGTCRSLIGLFLLQQGAKRDPGVEGPVRPREIATAAVVGAGVMGGGIAHALARAGIQARLKDINAEALGRGMAAAAAIFRRDLRRGRLQPREFDQKMALIRPTLDDTGLKRATVIIEAVVESLPVKRQVLAHLEEVAGADFIFASNTSSLPIGAIAAQARNPQNVVGLHFFNPVHRMPLVEVIRSERTSDETVATVVALAKRMGKTPIVVGDAPGFLVNRLLMTYLGEALVMIEEGARLDAIDRIMLAFGMPMGPFALIDQIGIDVAGHVALVLEEAFRERVPRTTALQILKEKGWLGRKSGRGFYVYRDSDRDGEGSGGASREVNAQVHALVSNRPRHEVEPGPTEIRLVLPMINEAARCLESGLVRSPEQVDLGMVLGTGFPPFRGGLLRHADTLGILTVVQGLETLATRHGTRFVASRLLLEMARAGQRFYPA
jgi:3-hydroxyacyl-CoA dehydrogenase/enoyl-CoA hydratase/3-hydroxybutyryl-CoA epimerase